MKKVLSAIAFFMVFSGISSFASDGQYYNHYDDQNGFQPLEEFEKDKWQRPQIILDQEDLLMLEDRGLSSGDSQGNISAIVDNMGIADAGTQTGTADDHNTAESFADRNTGAKQTDVWNSFYSRNETSVNEKKTEISKGFVDSSNNKVVEEKIASTEKGLYDRVKEETSVIKYNDNSKVSLISIYTKSNDNSINNISANDINDSEMIKREFSKDGRLTKIINYKTGITNVFNYNKEGKKTTVKAFDKNGKLVSRKDYDSKERLVCISDSEGRVNIRNTYNDDGSIEKKTYVFDSSGKVEEIITSNISPEGRIISQIYEDKVTGESCIVPNFGVHDIANSLMDSNEIGTNNDKTIVYVNDDGTVDSEVAEENGQENLKKEYVYNELGELHEVLVYDKEGAITDIKTVSQTSIVFNDEPTLQNVSDEAVEELLEPGSDTAAESILQDIGSYDAGLQSSILDSAHDETLIVVPANPDLPVGIENLNIQPIETN